MKNTNHQDRGNVYTLVIALIGLAKIICQIFGLDWGISDEQANDIANGIAALFAAFGVYFNHSIFKRSFKKHD